MRRILLNIGCGSKKIPGFINIDRESGADMRADVADGLPFASNSVDGIFSEHFIEHLSQAEGLAFLRECRRVLAPHGVLRIATPDLDFLAERYAGNWRNQPWLNEFGYEWVANRCEMLNISMREWGRQWLYNEEELIRLASYAGLSLRARCALGQSETPELRGLESRRDSTLIVELWKSRSREEGDGLVSVLVPAYNPKYFRACLESALRQTYADLEIVICDDCPTNEVGQIVAEYSTSDRRIRYLKNDPPLGAYQNYLRCFSLAAGQYIKFLNDDDLLHPSCVERMVRCLRLFPEVTLVTSHRQRIDAEGNPLPDIPATRRPVRQDSLIEGVSLAGALLRTAVNFVGEPTTVMFRKRDLDDARPHILSFANRPVAWNVDVGMWLHLLGKGDAIYLFDTLSYFRQHREQQQAQPEALGKGNAAWQQLRWDGQRMGLWNPHRPQPLVTHPVELRPEWPEAALAHVRQAEIQINRGEFVTAGEALSQAVALVPDDPDLTVALGNVRLKLGDVEAARREFVKATVLAPAYAPAHSTLAAVLLHLGRAEEAEASARRALALNPADIDSLKVLARVCLDSERYGEAVQAYVAVLRLHPDDVETLLVVGNCYAEAGRPEDAKRFYQRVLQLDPGNTVAADNLAVVNSEAPAIDRGAATGLPALCPQPGSELSEGERVITCSPPSACGVAETPTTRDQPVASIVIVTYNSASTLRPCLESVLQCSTVAIELIVVDNASSDGTRAILADYGNRITVLLNAKNAGFSQACNQGIRASSGQYVVLLNPDTVVTSGWLERLLSHVTSDVGAVGPLSDYVAGLQKYHLHLPAHRPAAMTVPELAELLGRVNQGKAVETKLLIGFCMLLPRKVLDEVGLLDEELFLGNDDLDLSWRLRVKGYRLLVATDAFVHHEGQVSFKSEPTAKTTRLVQESTDRLYAKLQAHYGKGNVPDPEELWGIDWFKPTNVCEVRGAKSDAGTPHPAPRTSLIILTHNGLEHTQKCLASIEAHTPEPHEIIIVDNGSSDGTLDYLRDYMATHDNVRVIANRRNRGFAAGNNQGLALAGGDYLLLLNNDTIVTTGWLQRMLQVFEADPDVGIVGPMSNYVSGPQLVRDASYEGPEALEAFAAQWARDHAGQSVKTTRVVGFCLLTRREVIARIGGLDERFGSGNFEDDDFCIRAAQVGFRARIALDVFIHHTGGQTFKAAKIDYRESLLRNWELFKAKWGIPADTPYEKGYRLPPHAAQRSELVVPLPDVGADHRCEDQGRWWQETCGESVEPGDKDKSPAQPAVTEEAPLSVVIVGNGSGLTPLWPSLVQHTKHPLAITVPPSNGNGNGADSAHEVLCPKGWRLTTVDLSGVRILNQLMQSAGDDPVILLSSDIILTPGWLKRLLAALDRDQRIAVIGPTANHGSAPQQVKADYKGTGKALRQFALRRAHRYGGELAEVDSLAPFCLVFNCSACRQIGLLREDLELSAALSDYCARLQRADLTLAVALDAYVHVEQLAPRLKAVS